MADSSLPPAIQEPETLQLDLAQALGVRQLGLLHTSQNPRVYGHSKGVCRATSPSSFCRVKGVHEHGIVKAVHEHVGGCFRGQGIWMDCCHQMKAVKQR